MSLQSLLSFLEPIPKTPPKMSDGDTAHSVQPKFPNLPDGLPSSPTTTITASLLGQPPTITAADSDLGLLSTDSEDASSDLGINKVLKVMRRANDFGSGDVGGAFLVDPADFILKERLDEKESLLMDGMVQYTLPPQLNNGDSYYFSP